MCCQIKKRSRSSLPSTSRPTPRAAGTAKPGAPRRARASGPASSILFLLEPGQRSHWHKVDAAELWLHHAGGALTLSTAAAGRVSEVRLGPDFPGGEALQAVVETGQWQAARAHDRWVLVACVVAPAFRFEGFELAPPDWTPAGG